MSSVTDQFLPDEAELAPPQRTLPVRRERQLELAPGERPSPGPRDDYGPELDPSPGAASGDRVISGLDDDPGRRQRVRRLLRANHEIADELSLPSLYRRVCECAARLVDAPAASLAVLGARGEVVQLLTCTAPHTAVTLEWAEADEEEIRVLSAGLTPGETRTLRRRSSTPGARLTWNAGDAAMPIHYRGQTSAVLVVHKLSGRRFTPGDRDVLSSFAVTAGIAVEQAGLYEESRRRQSWHEEAARLSSGPIVSAGERASLQLVADSVCRLGDADQVFLWPAPASRPDAVLRATPDSPSPVILADLPLSAPDVLVKAALASRGVCGMTADHPRSDLATTLAAAGIGPLLAFSFGDVEAPHFMVVGRHLGQRPYTRADLDIALGFAHQLSLSIEVQRARSQRQELVLLQQRDRIAGDLQDHVAQGLYAAALQVQSVLAVTRTPDVRDRLEAALAILDTGVVHLRHSIVRLTEPGQLELSETD